MDVEEMKDKRKENEDKEENMEVKKEEEEKGDGKKLESQSLNQSVSACQIPLV